MRVLLTNLKLKEMEKHMKYLSDREKELFILMYNLLKGYTYEEFNNTKYALNMMLRKKLIIS